MYDYISLKQVYLHLTLIKLCLVEKGKLIVRTTSKKSALLQFQRMFLHRSYIPKGLDNLIWIAWPALYKAEDWPYYNHKLWISALWYIDTIRYNDEV